MWKKWNSASADFTGTVAEFWIGKAPGGAEKNNFPGV